MGICNLRHLNDEIKKRKHVVEQYRKCLDNVPGIKLCKPQKDVEPSYAYLPVVFDGFGVTRNQVFAKLGEQNMECYHKSRVGKLTKVW